MMNDTPDRIERMRTALTAQFAPALLEITDESSQHAGHAGASGGPHTHIAIAMRCAAFAGLTRIDIHRQINAALAAEFACGLHAMRIDAAAR